MSDVSSTITSPPTLAFSACATGQVTLDLTALGDPDTVGVVVFYKPATTNTWVSQVQRTAIGTFTITGLTDGVKYEFIAVPYDASNNLGPISNTVLVAMVAGASVFGLEELLNMLMDALKAVVWTGSATKVFNNEVFLVDDPNALTGEQLSQMRMPAALVYDMGEVGNVADEEPSFQTVRVGVTLLARGDGDPMGSKALTGGNRLSEVTTQGAGLLDINRMVIDQVDRLLQNSTFPVRFLQRFSSAAGGQRVGDMKHVAQKSYIFVANIKEAT